MDTYYPSTAHFHIICSCGFSGCPFVSGELSFRRAPPPSSVGVEATTAYTHTQKNLSLCHYLLETNIKCGAAFVMPVLACVCICEFACACVCVGVKLSFKATCFLQQLWQKQDVVMHTFRLGYACFIAKQRPAWRGA